jgi:phosphohistidine phosphatase SixA
MPDVVLSSPLARAWQTAQVLEEACGWPEPEEFPALEPDRRPAGVLTALRKRSEAERVVLVGHEPLMHELLSHFVGGPGASLSMEVKKGGTALIRFDRALRAGGGVLVWLLPPRVALASVDD